MGRPPKNMELVDSSADHAQAVGELVHLDYLVVYAGLGRELINSRHDAIGGYGAWMGNLIESAPFAKSAMIEERLAGIAITRLTEIEDRLHPTFICGSRLSWPRHWQFSIEGSRKLCRR